MYVHIYGRPLATYSMHMSIYRYISTETYTRVLSLFAGGGVQNRMDQSCDKAQIYCVQKTSFYCKPFFSVAKVQSKISCPLSQGGDYVCCILCVLVFAHDQAFQQKINFDC